MRGVFVEPSVGEDGGQGTPVSFQAVFKVRQASRGGRRTAAGFLANGKNEHGQTRNGASGLLFVCKIAILLTHSPAKMRKHLPRTSGNVFAVHGHFEGRILVAADGIEPSTYGL